VTTMPAGHRDIEAEVRAVREAVGLGDLSARGKLRFVGRDRRTWLQGQITNDVLRLPDGEGLYAAILNIQGHMLTDLRVFALPEALLADLPAETKERIVKTLDRYLIMEQVEIQDVTDALRLFSLQGPRAAALLGATLEEVPPLPPWGVAEVAWRETTLTVARVTHTGEEGYDLFVPAAQAAALWETLAGALPAHDGALVGQEALEVLRLEAGIPWWGRELDESIVPLEARLERAISMKKGCYIGQEIIARIDARGHVNNLLVGLRPEGEGTGGGSSLPARGDALVVGERVVGRVTAAAYSPALQAPIALGFLRREFTEPGTLVTIRTASAEQPARVASLPFVPARFGSPGAGSPPTSGEGGTAAQHRSGEAG
jgi:folate-binding protein YgfZ